MAYRPLIGKCERGHTRRFFKDHEGLLIARCVECDHDLEDVFRMDEQEPIAYGSQRSASIRD